MDVRHSNHAGLETRSEPLETREDDDVLTTATQAVDALRTAVEQRSTAIETRLTSELKSITDRLDAIDVRTQRPSTQQQQSDQQAELHRRAFGGFLRHGRETLAPEEARALIVGDNTKGGYLAPADFVAEVIKGIIQFSPVRQAARVGSTSLGEVELPRRTGRPTAVWVGETEPRGETGSTYGSIIIPVNEAACYVDVSNRLLEDAAINVEAEIASDLSEEFGQLEGEAYVVGDGVKKPLGFLDTASGLAYTPSGGASGFAATNPGDALITLMYAMAPAYRSVGVWMMNGATIGAVRKFKDSTGQYLWQPAIAAGQPETLLGRPIMEAPDMNDLGANTFPIAFGDFKRGFRIYDKNALTIMRDPFTQAAVGKVRFHARRRTGGAVVLSEAIRLLKCATS